MIYIYSILIEGLYFLLLMIIPKKSKLHIQLKDRNKIEMEYDSSLRYMFFYVSSAGELDQALPLAKLFKERGYEPLIFCFSKSGIEFAIKTNCEFKVMLSPIDSIFRWKKIFDLYRPNYTIVVRWEFWPIFLILSKMYTKKVSVVDVSFDSRKRSFISKQLLKWFFKKFDNIYLVSHHGISQLNRLGVSSAGVQVAGDTKYDRVISRSKTAFKGDMNKYREFIGSANSIIVGSAWQKDWRIVLNTYLGNIDSLGDWKLLIAPHDISPANIDLLKSDLRDRNLIYNLASQHIDVTCPILIVDSIGLLAKLYSICDLAFVGGAMHYRVHNVLEPSCFGMPVAFGPLFDTSQEAKELINKQLATVVNSESDLYSWWSAMQNIDFRNQQSKQILSHVSGLGGASSRIIEDLGVLANGKEAYNK